MKSAELKKFKLPDTSGVYFFKKGKDILYIGKATSLKDRVKSYFSADLIATRGPMILDMVVQADRVDHQATDSVLEALILEADLIKRHQPKYNTKEKDDKSWNYVCITKEELPKVIVIRGRMLKNTDGTVFGPFTNGLQLREALKIIRRIFPFIDASSSKKQNFQFYRQLGLVPAVAEPASDFSGPRGKSPDHKKLLAGSAPLVQYKKNIANLKLFFQGKKKRIISNLKKEMAAFSKSKDFENAARVRNQIFALQHINDVALIKEENIATLVPAFRIEAYDIAHMSGKNMVGVMTVVLDAQAEKREYKKFIIRTQSGANDTGALEEVLSRRFRHTEWGLPSLVVMDGGAAQINIAKKVLRRYQFNIPIVSVVKDNHHKAKAIMGEASMLQDHKKAILLANSEAHRFAIAFHKQKRSKDFLK